MPQAPTRHAIKPKPAAKPDYHRLYDRQWRKARLAFLRDHPLCAQCEREGMIRLATEVDHKTPHRGDVAIFWDESRWEGLCQPHHAAKSAAEGAACQNGSRRARVGGV